jgi:hypothetical protein
MWRINSVINYSVVYTLQGRRWEWELKDGEAMNTTFMNNTAKYRF